MPVPINRLSRYVKTWFWKNELKITAYKLFPFGCSISCKLVMYLKGQRGHFCIWHIWYVVKKSLSSRRGNTFRGRLQEGDFPAHTNTRVFHRLSILHDAPSEAEPLRAVHCCLLCGLGTWRAWACICLCAGTRWKFLTSPSSRSSRPCWVRSTAEAGAWLFHFPGQNRDTWPGRLGQWSQARERAGSSS